MKSKFFRMTLALSLVLCLCGLVLADTIRLKDGSIIKGKIIGFRDGQFVVSIGDGARARQMTFFADEVEAVEFDSLPLGSTTALNATTNPIKLSSPTTQNPRPQTNQTGNPTVSPNPTNSGLGSNNNPNNSNVIIVGSKSNTNPQPANNGSGGSGTGFESNSSSTPSYTNSTTGNVNANTIPVSSNPTSGNGTTTTPPRPKPIQLNVKVLADNTSNGWTNSGFHVKKGQKFRVLGRGQISLGGGNYAKPKGIKSLTDDKKLIATEATGGLIAVIGDDNNDFIFIGAAREFTAARDGMLFLGINENNLADNSGSFDVTIEIEPLN
ncbi:MAG TPA: hypothetical protein VK400_14940 [Pyrinomonadaceae bacterium]|nr:hypothetical protein [Pyrinomonadaceae bacterium]